MMIFVLSLALILKSAAAFGVVALPPATGTNNLAALQASQIRDRETARRFCDGGQIAELQKQADRLEIEVVLLAFGLGGIVAALILLLDRDRVRELKRVPESHAKESNANK